MAERAVLTWAMQLDLNTVMADPADPIDPLMNINDVQSSIEQLKLKRTRWNDLIDEGDDDARERSLRCTKEIKELTKTLAEMRAAENLRSAEPSAASRQRSVMELFRRLDHTEGAELAALRTRLAQELRAVIAKIGFSRHQITVTRRQLMKSLTGKGYAGSLALSVYNDHPAYVSERNAETFDDPETIAQEKRNSDKLDQMMLKAGIKPASSSANAAPKSAASRRSSSN